MCVTTYRHTDKQGIEWRFLKSRHRGQRIDHEAQYPTSSLLKTTHHLVELFIVIVLNVAESCWAIQWL